MNPLRRPQARGLPLWVWAGLTGLTLWWLYVRPARRGWPEPDIDLAVAGDAQAPDSLAPQPSEESSATSALPHVPAAAAKADDLTRLNGIGPATARRLQAGGIHTFAQLAAADEAQLRGLVQGVGLGLADPSTWREQARLAAQADWDGLAAFVERRRARRR